jgi:hypothetical protein
MALQRIHPGGRALVAEASSICPSTAARLLAYRHSRSKCHRIMVSSLRRPKHGNWRAPANLTHCLFQRTSCFAHPRPSCAGCASKGASSDPRSSGRAWKGLDCMRNLMATTLGSSEVGRFGAFAAPLPTGISNPRAAAKRLSFASRRRLMPPIPGSTRAIPYLSEPTPLATRLLALVGIPRHRVEAWRSACDCGCLLFRFAGGGEAKHRTTGGLLQHAARNTPQAARLRRGLSACGEVDPRTARRRRGRRPAADWPSNR